MEIYLRDIIDFLGSDIIDIKGDYNQVVIKYLKDASEVDSFSLDWINPAKENKQVIADNSKAKALLVDKTVLYNENIRTQKKVLIFVKDPKVSLLKIGNHFFVKKIKPEIHPTASISKKAVIGTNVFIGAGCVLGDCTINDGAIIHPNVVIYDNVIIEEKVVIHSGAVVGADGLGCIRQSDGTLLEFPQLGGVRIGKNVRIGPTTTIYSGALSKTVIGDGCKINGACFIGSNCLLGKNVWITGSSMLAGSVKVGDNVTIFSKVIVREQKTIGTGATIGMGSVVTKDIPAGETWLGNPAKKFK